MGYRADLGLSAKRRFVCRLRRSPYSNPYSLSPLHPLSVYTDLNSSAALSTLAISRDSARASWVAVLTS